MYLVLLPNACVSCEHPVTDVYYDHGDRVTIENDKIDTYGWM